MIDLLIARLKGFLLDPVETFRKSRDDDSRVLFFYFGALFLLNAILSARIGLFFGIRNILLPSGMSLGSTAMLTGFFIIMMYSVIFILLLTAWIHLWVYLFGGRKGIMQTFKAILYGDTPNLLLGWIPFIGIIFTLWSLVLGVLGIRELQEISTRNAVLAVTIAIITMLIPVILLTAYLMTSNMVFIPVPVSPGT
ncbi:YIP1 family protein [Methanoregula sp.]|uniref:YIP1 family protein n=1 Tax=Methanoregula sp. TaxID=2052170 RepID=UPI0035662D19